MREVALVVGGTSGIGKAQVERWVKEGYEVVFCGRNEEKGSQIALENKATFIKCDITKTTEVQEMFKQVKDKFGRLDVILNNAGMAVPAGRIHETPLETVQQAFEINTLGAWKVLKFGLAAMVEFGNGGRVINTASLAGIGAAGAKVGSAHYSAAKAALVNMTQNCAIQYISDKIRVNAVAPTAIETELVKGYISSSADPVAVKKGINALNPWGSYHDEMPQVEDVTGVISFLAGPDAKFVNGQTIAIDGGYSIQ